MNLRFPIIIDKNIKILPFNESHVNSNYVSWLNDTEVVRYSEQRHLKHSLKTCFDYYFQQNNSNNIFLAIEFLENDFKHVGNIGVKIDDYNGIADLSIIIGDKAIWGLGIGSRAWILTLDTLLNRLNFRKVTAGTMENNQKMISLICRSGMKIDAVLPGRFLFEGSEIGLVMASISKMDNLFLNK